MPLTQTQLASEVADRSGLTKSDAKAALAALEEVVLEELGNAEKVRIGGVVQLVVRVKEATKPRQGRNPATRACPLVGRSSVVRMRTVVVLPAPFGPSRPSTAPSGTSRLTPSIARTHGINVNKEYAEVFQVYRVIV